MDTQRALILDFGGVITRTLFETHEQSERALGLDPGTLTWRGPFDVDSDDLWSAMQADEITERDYWLARTKEVGALVGQDWAKMSDLLQATRGDAPNAVIRPEFLITFNKAKEAGVKLAILSNELDLFYGPAFRKRLSFIDAIDVVCDATYTNILKPDAKAYQACLHQLRVPAENCVFVDDQKRNIDGARKVGLNTVQFDVMNPQESFQRAERLLGIADKD